MILRSLACAFALVVAGVAAPAHAVATPPPANPEQVVKTIAAQLSTALDGHRDELKKDHDALVNMIDKIVLPHFDIDYASILVLGRHARQATPQQRAQFAKAFYDSITQRYAEGLLSYTRGRVKVLPFEGQLNDRRSVVRTRVMMDDGKTVSVDYVFRKTHDGDWKAYDVVVEGISYITNYRSQVDAEIRKVGIEGLISRLKDQGVDALKAPPSGGQH
jgi:phospholipid transport system substrate-binding protein